MKVVEIYPFGHRTVEVISVVDDNGNRILKETQIEILDNNSNPTSLEMIQAREVQTQVSNPEYVHMAETLRESLGKEIRARRQALIESARQTRFEYFD